LITGASGDLGRAVTHLLAESGWTVAMVSRDRSRLEGLGTQEMLRTNLDSAFFMLKAFVNALIKKKAQGAACLVSTVAARIGVSRHEAVAAAKACVEGLVRSAAAGYSARGIRVNAIAPGLMRTPATERFFGDEKMVKQLDAQYPLGRHGRAEDGASAMAWLLSDDAEWITGQILSVDGGFTAVRPMVHS
jgi:NAD(P)-dependent dehydrogenase (short-subunit alcohol dehydrogenase family)